MRGKDWERKIGTNIKRMSRKNIIGTLKHKH